MRYGKIILDKIRRIYFEFIGRIYDVPNYFKEYTLKKRDIIIDCGAYTGGFSIYAAERVGPLGKVIAFEPNPANYNILLERIQHRKLKNIFLIKKSIWDNIGHFKLTEDPVFGSFGSSLFLPKSKYSKRIKTTTLAHEIKKLKLNKIDFIKMDIEGAEVEVINSSKEILREYSPHLAIACYHKRDNKTTGEILSPIIKKLNYSVKIGGLLHPTLFARKIL